MPGVYDTTNRKDVRSAIAAGISAPGVLPATATVYGYMATGFEGLSPVVRVVSAGSMRPEFTARGTRSRFYYSVQLWVLFFEDGEPDVQQAAEDALDDLEEALLDWLIDNQTGALWTAISFADRSRTQVVLVGGSQYIMEDIPIAVDVFG